MSTILQVGFVVINIDFSADIRPETSSFGAESKALDRRPRSADDSTNTWSHSGFLPVHRRFVPAARADSRTWLLNEVEAEYTRAAREHQMRSVSAPDELLSCLYSDRNNSGRRGDISAPSAEVYLQMSAASPEECHTTAGRIRNEERRPLSGSGGYSGTANEN